MGRIILIILLLGLGAAGGALAPGSRPAASQPTGSGIQSLVTHQVSTDEAERPHVESHIAVDSRDPKHLLATAMALVNGEFRSHPYASFDGGLTWTRGRVIGNDAVVGVDTADPVVLISSSGVCGFVSLGSDRTYVARSTDGGRTWQTTAVLPYTDRPWLVFDSSRGPFGGRAYFTGTGVYQTPNGDRGVAPFLARSDDGIMTFPFRSLISMDRGGPDPAAPLNAVPLEPLVTSRGLLVLTLQGAPGVQAAERAKRESLNAWGIGLAVSDDGGESFGPARYAPTARFSLTGSARRRHRAHSATGYVRPVIDTSSAPFRDRIYFVAADYDATVNRYVARVWFTWDFGKTWGTAVASDAPLGDVANPAIAVNRDGIVAVTWNDRRDDPQGRCWRLYAALSVNGGAHFLPGQRLSLRPTCTNEPRNWETSGSAFNGDQSGRFLAHFSTDAYVPSRFPMGGDSQGLAADATGAFHGAWINGETGVLQLWYTGFRAAPALTAEMRAKASAGAAGPAAAEPATPGMEEVTHDIRFEVTNSKLDFARRTWAVTLEIENRSGRTIPGPLRAVMRHFLDAENNGLGLKNLAAVNADRGGPGIGATWDFAVPGGILAPGARSEPRVLLFAFEGGVPEYPEGGFAPGFQVFCPAK